MKTFKLMVLGLFALLALPLGAAEVETVINEGATGSTSATVIAKPARGYGQVTDIATRVDANVTSATVDIRIGTKKLAVSSATSGSSTVLWTATASTFFSVGDYLVYEDVSLGTYLLMRVSTVNNTTSLTMQENTGVATTTSDLIYTLGSRIRRPVGSGTPSETQATSVWIPSNMPTAFTLDGNTTSCQISISGVRSPGK